MQGSKQYAVSPWRFVALFQFMLLSSTNALQWVIYATIIDQAKAYFDISSLQVNLLTTSYFFVYCLMAVVPFRLFSRVSTKTGLFCACTLNCAGAFLRLLGAAFAPSFWTLLVAQLVCAVAQGFFFAVPPILAAGWFSDEERTWATTSAAAANNVGIALGMLLPPQIVTPEHHGRWDFVVLCLVPLVLTSIDLLLCVFVVPRKPEVPPSPVAVLRHEELEKARAMPFSLSDEVAGVKRALIAAWKVPTFGLLSVSIGLNLGVTWALAGLLAQLFGPFGVSESECGWLGFSNICVGTAVAIAVGWIIDRMRMFKLPLIFFMATETTLLIVVLVVLSQMDGVPRKVAVFVAYIIMGMVQNSIVPVGFEYAAEITFPLEESVSGTILIFSANFFGFFMVLLLPSLFLGPEDPNSALVALWTIIGILTVSLAFMGFTSSVYRRQSYEKLM